MCKLFHFVAYGIDDLTGLTAKMSNLVWLVHNCHAHQQIGLKNRI